MNIVPSERLEGVRDRARAMNARNFFSPEEYVSVCEEVLAHRKARELALAGLWGSKPGPVEAAANLREHAGKKGLPPGDNDFEDAAGIIDALVLLAYGRLTDQAVDRAFERARLMDVSTLITNKEALRAVLQAAFPDGSTFP